ncbi:MAG: recombinase RecT, partial [Nitratireductor sp.]|nr:recombinase RecT [Nitratireductor sp.]
MNTEEKPKLPVSVGGAVMAIVPRSIEEIWRVAKMVVVGGLAPQSLVGVGDKAKTGDEAVSAVSIAIMFGAELGLPPMAALRSMTVINGRPALYGDGLVSVIRRSGKAAYITMGYSETEKIGWCAAKRIDTGEELRVVFSQADAIQAGLWSDQPTVRRNGRNGPYETANDSPWYRYPKRMLQWRATGYCLRNLFADVLAGVLTDDEAREASGEYVEYEDVNAAPSVSTSKTPPPPPPP